MLAKIEYVSDNFVKLLDKRFIYITKKKKGTLFFIEKSLFIQKCILSHMKSHVNGLTVVKSIVYVVNRA